MTFLYDFPNWMVGLMVPGVIVAATLAAYLVFWRLCRLDFSGDDRGLALAVLAVIATINSLLLAFSAVSVWESFAAAEEAVVHEADTVGEIARDLAVFDSVESRQARVELRKYVETVIAREWTEMRTGQASLEAWQQNDTFFRAVGTIEPDTPRRAALMPEIWAQANQLVAHRRDRLYFAQAAVPGTLWAVVLAGSLLTMLTTFVLPPTRLNVVMIAALAATLGLVFFFILSMDRPFAGEQSVSPAPFETALANMDRWDGQSSTAAR